MLKITSILFFFLLLTSCQTQPSPQKVKVLTFNILGGRNIDGKHDLTRLAKIINTLKPDIVAMQEVDKGTKRIKGRDITKEIAELTGMHHAFGKAMKFQGGEYGEAILSRQPILEVINHSLPAQSNAEPRAALEVLTTIPGTKIQYSFIATHLDHLKSDINRLMQVKAINKLLVKKEPFILAGDLNATLNSRTILGLSKYIDFNEVKSATYPTEKPKIKIDWIGSDKSGKWQLKKVYTADKFKNTPEWSDLLKVTSDHLPLMKEYIFIE